MRISKLRSSAVVALGSFLILLLATVAQGGSSSPERRLAGNGPISNTAAPAISGVLDLGQTLSAAPGGWTGAAPITFSYQWLRCDGKFGTTCAAIANATAQTYEVVAADIGKRLRVRVTATNATSSGVARSEPTARIVPSSGTYVPPADDSRASQGPQGPSEPSGENTANKPNVLTGTRQNDILRGTPGVDVIRALAGDDRLAGGAGPDTLFAGNGRDQLTGGAGNDKLVGGLGNDTLKGGGGADQLLGGGGRDRYFGGGGNDTIRARDGKREIVDCGKGRDTAIVDRVDRVRACEIVRIA